VHAVNKKTVFVRKVIVALNHFFRSRNTLIWSHLRTKDCPCSRLRMKAVVVVLLTKEQNAIISRKNKFL
jgi:redox-regulated HSP33 family molecular chaperone